jgi:uncharacterized membrane protein
MFCFFRGLFLWPLAALSGLLGYEAGQSGQLRQATGNDSPSDPLDIAKTRYASGEITKQEFDRIKKDLA